MKYNLKYTGKFKKDIKLAKKRGLNIEVLFDIVNLIANDIKLPEKNKDHELLGNYVGSRECHIQPDWLLIYEKDTEIKLLSLIRTGSHSDLFGK